ncbi:hypothetical protein MSAN_02188100 [Mycena sanguinolenta]|uniref:Uncharacterized protein n=1 Tax=Mycena sanguinolenta TaxID=230812 RepID=A0A8H6XFQ7_9AGAR|nr:hypothetical protein MSAN_02188100 [Mycena sanguinolenta]
MPATDADGNPLQLNLPPAPLPADVLALAATDAVSQDEPSEQEGTAPKPVQSRPLMIYTRPQMLYLQSSPLVKSPPDMPELKHWFGEHEPNPKKDSEPTTPNGARERRFRRDADDGETSTRPSFRSALSQPSQMGNFKHQSLRDRERDGDKDRERDIRDKEGQERLRHLSDKYDRDRLAAPGLRNKERDIAPHLAVDSSIRGSTSLSAAARRAEARDNAKKKVGEVSEDWRRGSHPTRQERYESSRGNREDRERPRSRVRDSSRPRRDVSSSRPNRDRDGDDRDLAGDRRDDHRKTTRDDRRTRDDHRRERDDRRERDRGLERDADEDEDPRRWRDDGKRDERMAARRAAEKASQENGDASGDRRWTVVEDRDGRSKRNHRDRRVGAAVEEGKDREDRRDRDREREKEPAWMDTYIPESPGIPVGSKGADGELDGIQAWKKGLKEKEKAAVAPPKKDEEPPAASEPVSEKPMDEIQIFRMLMKREEEKKQVEPSPAETTAFPPPGIRAKVPQATSSQISQTPESAQAVISDPTNNAPAVPPTAAASAPAPAPSSTPVHDTNSLLAILGKTEPISRPPPLANLPPVSDNEKILPQAGSRFFPKPISQQNAALTAEKPTMSDPAPSAQFNPPPGSRLLAFGAGRAGKSPSLPAPANGLSNGLNQQDSISQHSTNAAVSPDLPINLAPPKSEGLRSGFSPFEDQAQSRMSFGFDESRDQFAGSEALGRGDRAPHGLPADAGSYADPAFDPALTGYSTGKGSRLAKFFDSRGREAPASQNPVGFTSTTPNPNPRLDGGYNPMDGLLSKLNSSAQMQRPNIMSPNSAGVPFGQQAQNNLQIFQQQQQLNQTQHLHLNNRLDALYESRLEDRNFVPDGMVPGLRSTLPPRNRDSVYSDSADDPIHFSPNPQRLPPQHHRGLDPMYNLAPSGFVQPGARNVNIPIQPQFRGAPSPISNPQQQRLPPGLANLGGRPPLDNSQFMGMPGLPNHSGLHNGPPQQQQFNNFAVNGNLNNYGGGLQPQMRVPPTQLQGNLQHHQLAGLGHPNIDLQRSNQAQLLNLGGGGMRGLGMSGGGFGPQQGGPPGQMQQPLHALRQQEQQRQQQLQQQLPPHMLQHHLQAGGHPHQQGIAPANNGSDLMALLMGGTAHHRD